ncbi:MAG: peptidylprolyl isomerase [Bacilli bacterium]|nr:peptidylprolyl isomerase [Bacilli bacterium]
MKNIKKIVILSLIMLTVVGCGAVPTLKNGEQKVASLKKDGISADALYEKMKTKYGAQEFIDLLDTEILNQKYKETTTEKENINSQIEELKKSAKENNVTYEQILSYYGFENEKSLKDYLRLSYRRKQAVNDYVSKMLSDKEIKSYYDKNIYGDIKAKHILISPNTTSDMTTEQKEEAENKAKKQAEDIIKKLDKKEDFSKLAKKYSDDSATAKKGGDLGWFSTGDMVAEFDEAAFKLKKGTYTKTPVKTTYGYHIIYKVDEKKKPTLKDSKKTIVDALVKEKLEKDKALYYTALDNIRKNAGLKFEDDDLKKAYTKYVQNQKSQATSSAQ